MSQGAADFDPDYFRETRPQWSGVDDEACRRAWSHDPLGAGPGTPRAHLAGLKLDLAEYPTAFPWRFYARRHPSVGAHRWVALDDFVLRGFALDPDLPYGPDATRFLTALARGYAGRSDRLAIMAFELAAAHGSLAPEESQHLADSYFREGMWAPARAIYRRLLRDDAGSNWTVRNLLRASLPLGDVEGIVEALASTQGRMAEDEVWRGTVSMLVEWVYERHLRAARSLYADDARDEGDAAVAAGVGRAADLIRRFAMLDVAAARAPTTVVMVANLDDPTARRCRIDGRAALFERLGIPFTLMSMGELAAFPENLANAKAVIFFDVPATVDLLKTVLAARALGVPTIYEADASIFDPDCSPPPFEAYGGFIAPALHDELKLAVVLYREFARLCDVGLAATRGIADRLASIVGRRTAYVLSPASGEHFQLEGSVPAPGAPERPLPQVFLFLRSVRFVCLGGESDPIGAAILDVLKRSGTLGLVTSGYVWLAEAFNAFGDRVAELGPSTDPHSYRPILAAARLNLAIEPAHGDDGMIELSWLEAAELGVPTLLPTEIGQSLGLEDGVTALLGGATDWGQKLTMDQPADTSRIGQAAQAKATADRGVDRLADQLSTVLDAVLEERAMS